MWTEKCGCLQGMGEREAAVKVLLGSARAASMLNVGAVSGEEYCRQAQGPETTGGRGCMQMGAQHHATHEALEALSATQGATPCKVTGEWRCWRLADCMDACRPPPCCSAPCIVFCLHMARCIEPPHLFTLVRMWLFLFTPVILPVVLLVVQVLVMADAAANPVHVAADLLSQAEHGPDSQVRDGSGTVGSIKECRGGGR